MSQGFGLVLSLSPTLSLSLSLLLGRQLASERISPTLSPSLLLGRRLARFARWPPPSLLRSLFENRLT